MTYPIVPDPSIHRTPPATQPKPISPARINQFGVNIIIGIAKQLVHIFSGGTLDATIDPALDNLQAIWLGVQTSATTAQTNSQALTDGVVNWFGGLTGAGFGNAVANTSLQTAQNTIQQTAQGLAAIQARDGGASNSGQSVVVGFSGYGNGALPGAFTVTYGGAGTSVIGVFSGIAQPVLVNDADRSWSVRYNALQTNTDYQIVGLSLTTGPDGALGGAQPARWIRARVNAADSSYIYAEFTGDGNGNYFCELGYVLAGFKTIWVPSTQVPALTNYWLACGTTGGARIYQVLAGTTPVITYAESGTSSAMGASNRYTGWRDDMRYNALGPRSPGGIAVFAFADNQPPATVGSGGHVYRTSTATSNLFGGGANSVMPGSFFGVVKFSTSDVTVDLSTSKYTATNAGWYEVKCRVKFSSSVAPATLRMVLFKNGSFEQAGVNMPTAGIGATAMWGSWMIYLAPGDYIQPGYFSDGITANVMTGESTGIETYFNMALANRSLS